MGLFAEPLNAVSNVSFLLAAWAAWVMAKRIGALSAGVRVLIAMAASVGVGSILWHTYPTMLTLILDIVPILIFIVWFIWLYTQNVVGMRPCSPLHRLRRSWRRPSLPSTCWRPPRSPRLHARVGGHAGARRVPREGTEGRPLRPARGRGRLLAALFFRTIDNEVCPVLPIGTHFLWHVLIGLVTYLAMRSLILSHRTEVRARVR
jgi:hypothetical protein